MTHHTDRELLELAARAALSTTGSLPIWAIDYEGNIFICDRGPLENDGDAFRLMCQLSMRVYVYNGGGDDYTVAATDELRPSKIVTQVPHNNGVYEATRRAIVLAAAEIGAAL